MMFLIDKLKCSNIYSVVNVWPMQSNMYLYNFHVREAVSKIVYVIFECDSWKSVITTFVLSYPESFSHELLLFPENKQWLDRKPVRMA